MEIRSEQIADNTITSADIKDGTIANGDLAGSISLDKIITPYRASVASYATLPTSGNTTGDIRFVSSLNNFYSWDGYSWLPSNYTPDTFTAYYDAAQALPIDGTGATTGITVSRNTNTPVSFDYDWILTKDSSNRQGYGASYPFNIKKGDVGSIMEIDFSYFTSSNYADGYIGVYFYDVVNNNIICPSIVSLPSSTSVSQYKAVFIPSTSTSYRLILHITTATTTNWSIEFGSVSINKQTVAIGAVVGGTKKFTPSLSSGFGTPTVLIGEYTRVGEYMEAYGTCVPGTVSASIATIAIPDGLTLATYDSTVSLLVGSWDRDSAVGSNSKHGAIIFVAGSTNQLHITNDGDITAASPFYGTNVSALFANAQGFSFRFKVKIAQWTSNVNLVSDFTEYASNSGGEGVAAGTNYYSASYNNTGAEGSLIPAAVSTVTNAASYTGYRCTFNRPLQDSDKIFLEMKKASSAWVDVSLADVGGFGPKSESAARYGMWWQKDTTDASGRSVLVYFNNAGALPINATYGSMGYAWSNLSSARYRVRKVSNGNMAEIPTIVRTEIRRAATQTVTTSAAAILKYDTVIEDTHSAYSTSTGLFTAPIAGVYSLSGMLLMANAIYTGWAYFGAQIYKNGSFYACLPAQSGPTMTAGVYPNCPISATIRLKANETINIYLTVGSQTSSVSTHPDGGYNWLTITWIGK